MDFPYLDVEVIDGEAAALLEAVFGGPWLNRTPVDLEAIVYDYLSPRENLSFNPLRRGGLS